MAESEHIQEAADLLLSDPNLQSTLEEVLTSQNIGRTTKEYAVQRLNDVHKEIIRLRVQGVSIEDIANAVGYEPCSIRHILKSPIVRNEINRLHSLRDFSAVEATARLDGLVDKAISVYEEVVNGEVEVSPADQVRVANEILDRTGFGRVSKVEGNHRVSVLTAADVMAIKEEALARARECGNMLDLTPKEEGAT